MTRPKIVFCYRYGLLGGVSAQLFNRFPYLSREYDIEILFEQDHGMASRFPAGTASVVPTVDSQTEALRKAKPDVVVVIDSPSFLTAWRTAGSPGKLVLEVHTTTANVGYLQNHGDLAGMSHVITVSSYMEDLLKQHGLDKIAPISVVPNCLSDQWDEPSVPVPLTGNPIVWVGKLDSHKRWRTAVDLIDQLSEEQSLDILPILIGGLTSPVAEVMALTTRLATSTGMANGVWWPRVDYSLMPALYTSVGHNGGVQLCTTLNESFGMAVAESIVRGCPVIAPAIGALPELLPPAALYEPENWSEARQKTRQALVDSSFREELLSTAKQVRELTRPENIQDAYRAVVNSVLSR